MKLQRADGTAARRAALQVLGDIRNGRQFDAALAAGDTVELVHFVGGG